MQTYEIPLVPGPVSIPAEVLDAYRMDYGSADLEDEFFDLYGECEAGLQKILETDNDVTIQTGEGMLALWGALKSVLEPGDRVLAVSTGLFGHGIGEMARTTGAAVEILEFPNNDVADPDRVRDAALRLRPKLITAVHCETPSGTLNPVGDLGAISREVDALFYVDFVASGGGARVAVDANHIDLGLLGSQKVLSLMPDLSMVSVSPRAWDAVEAVGYAGYDALAPWRTALEDRYFPYTHNWHALTGLRVAIKRLLNPSPQHNYNQHNTTAALCRQRLQAMGIKLFPVSEAICSPTVTAAYVPEGWTWTDLDAALRARGMAVGGNYGDLAGKVFRVGHMGSQADPDLVGRGMDVLEEVLSDKRTV